MQNRSSGIRILPAILCTVLLFSLSCGGSSSSSGGSNPPPPNPGTAGSVQQRSLTFQSTKYDFYVYAPTTYDGQHALPALLVVHGAGSNGLDFINLWKDFAEKNGFILVSPTMQYTANPSDLEPLAPPLFISLMNQAGTEWKMDTKRLYVFGYSAGGIATFFAIKSDSTFFAGAGIFAAIILPGNESIATQAARKLPIAMYIGDHDQFFTLDQARATRDLLLQNNFPVHYVELTNQDHSFTTASPNIEGDMWQYLSQFSLP